ncbi:PAS domain S-box protein [Desulfobacter curvatus]|uniref:PAS domain S-box protein n=1 Tax=Desulfobacter curvatus TaxID=2290 RepID=UPI0003778B40|nr:PAS domain S-box protein [Desulfobacter curvatus]
MGSNISLKNYLSRHFAVVAVLPVVTIACLTYGFMLPTIKARTGLQHQAMARSIAGQISSHLAGGERQILALAEYLSNRQFKNNMDLADLLDAHCGNGEFFEALFVVDNKNGLIQAAGLGKFHRLKRSDFIGLDFPGRRFILSQKGSEKPAWSQIFLSTLNSRPAVAATFPLANGVIIGEMALDNLSAFIGHLPVKSELLTLVVDERGKVLADSLGQFWGQILKDDFIAGTGSKNTPRPVSKTFELNGRKMLGTVVDMDETGWKILIAQPVGKAFQSLWNILTLIGLGLFLALTFSLFIGQVLAGKFSFVVESYIERTASVADGAYDLQWPQHKTKEFSLLSQRLERMAQKINQREDELKAGEERIKDILVNIPGVVFQHIADPKSDTSRAVNTVARERGMETFGLDFNHKNLIENFVACLPENDQPRFVQSVEEAIELLKPWHYEGRFTKPSGKKIWFEGHSTPRKINDVIFHYGVLTDISQRKNMETSLRLAKSSLDKAPIGIWRMGYNGRVLDVNEQGCRSLGYSREELCRMSVFDFDPDQSVNVWKNMVKQLRKAGSVTLEMHHRRKNGDIFPIQVITAIMYFEDQEYYLAFVQDISERKQMEEIIIQSEKMLSVGGLAAGMAHEINNPLAGMVQTAQVMAQRLTADLDISASRKAAEAADTSLEAIEQFMAARGIPRMIRTIIESGQRVSEIVNNILNFSRKDEATVSTHYLDKILDKTVELAATDYNLKKAYDFKQIKITREYDGNLPAVPCQAGKIQQVILNILANGAMAMQEAGTSNPEFILRTFGAPARDMVCMEIEDNGPGMNEKTRKQIFDPFFTTKPVGVGTGLGLSVSYFIITEHHKGEMAVESSPGAGAKFVIRIPLTAP